MKRCFLVVIDSLGVGEAPDAKEYGDIGSNTLGNVANYVGGVNLPNFNKLGFGKITNVKGMETKHIGTVGRLSELSIGNDSTTGHWELAGLVTKKKFLESSTSTSCRSRPIENRVSYPLVPNYPKIRNLGTFAKI